MTIKNLPVIILIAILFFCHKHSLSQEQPKKTKIGLTLSGGAASGLAHIGVLQAIDKAELNIDYISGTSMGAIIGALYAAGYSGKDIEDIVTSTDFIEIFHDKPPFTTIPMEGREEFNNYMLEIPIKRLNAIIPTGLIEGQTFWLKLSSLLAPVYDIDTFSNLSIPFKAIAADLEKGEVVVLDKGNLPDALRASAAIPYIFKPIKVNGRELIDGGVLRNFPVTNTIESGANYNIGVNVGINDNNIKLNSAIAILSHLSRYLNMFDIPKEIEATNMYIYLGPYDDMNSSINFTKAGLKKILAKGKNMTEAYYTKFKELSDSLKKNDPNYTFKRNRLPKTRKVYIKQVLVDGIDDRSSLNFIKILGLNTEKLYSIDEINNYVVKLLGKSFYKNVRYMFEKDNNGEFTTIRFSTEEADKNYFKVGLFYNNTLKTTLKFNITSRNLLTKESSTVFTAYISKYPSINVNNIFYNSALDNIRLLTIGAKFKRSAIKPTFYNNFTDDSYNNVLDLNITEDYISSSGRIFYEPIQNLSLSIFGGLAFTKHRFNSYNTIETTNTKVHSHTVFATLGPSLEADTRDKNFFPSKGLYWNLNTFFIKPINIQYNNLTHEHNPEMYDQLKKTFLQPYGTLQLYSDFNWYFPITNFFVINLGSQIGLNFAFKSHADPVGINQTFLLGGLNQNINRNQITFIGLNDASFIVNNAVVGLINLQFNPVKNLYISFKSNYLGYYNGGSIFKGLIQNSFKNLYGNILGSGLSCNLFYPIRAITINTYEKFYTQQGLSLC
ncbi:MAG: patatin-like phospholipase family protein [Solitalea-like symbiont of Acarus siro]